MPDKTRAAFSRVLKMESVEEVELESAFGLPVALLISLARLKYLALSNVNLDADEGIHSTSPCEVALEGLYLRGVSSRVIKTLTKTLSISADAPPTLCRLVLTPSEEVFAEEATELILACGSHLMSLGWLPSIHFRESTLIESRPTADKYSSFLPRPNQHIHTPPLPLSPLHHHLTPHKQPFSQTTSLLLQLSNRPNTVEKNHRRMSLKESLAKLWRPLYTALSAMSSGEPVFGKLKEMEIVLSASTIQAAEIHRFMMGQGAPSKRRSTGGDGISKNGKGRRGRRVIKEKFLH